MNTIIHLHSIIRWILLILLITVIIQSFLGLIKNKKFSKLNNKSSLWLMIITHTQFLIGIMVFLISSKVKLSAIKETMSTDYLRFFTIEHPVMMIISVILITIGRISSKKSANDLQKFKKLLIFNIIALIIILFAIPWPFSKFQGTWI